MGTGSLAISIVFAIIIGLAISEGRDRLFRGNGWFFLRAFFPSWRFFEDVGELPKLRYRLIEPGRAALTDPSADVGAGVGDVGWLEVMPPLPRRWHHLFLNSGGNLRLASQSLVERFASDLEDLPEGADATRLVSYELASRWVRFRIRESVADAGSAVRFEFKLVWVRPGLGERGAGESFFFSGEHEVWAND